MRADQILRSTALSTFVRLREIDRAPVLRRAADVWVKLRTPRTPPTLYQRCLAVHIHNAGPQSALT